jgi:hypothetical protein
MNIILSPEHLNSSTAIRKRFGVGIPKIRLWHEQGAPIAIERNAKGEIRGYSAEYNALQAWRVEQSRTK